MEKISDIRRLIQGEIKKTFGQEVLYAKDCQVLSISIHQKTNRSISVSTLKRLFGIVASPYLPSKYTLDTIALFLHYNSWSELEEMSIIDQQEHVEKDYWSALKSRIEIVTNRSLASIRTKLDTQLLDFKPREFAIRKFEAFLQSSCMATAFIAPGGYGKTTMTAQLTEHFFTNDEALYPDDIVCLIDGSMLVNILNLNLEIVRLKSILDVEGKESLATLFAENPELVKGRFVLIIESLYQIYHQEAKLKDFVENLMDILTFYKETPWFKCLITCRPENWKLFSHQIQTRPDFMKYWYGVTFEGSSADYTNVPLLNADEIDYFLRRRYSKKRFEKIKFLYDDMKELLSIPYLLNLYSSIESPSNIHSDLGILESYFSKNILVEPFLEEKHAIIDAFIRHTDYAKRTLSVEKPLLPTTGAHKWAYETLIFQNIIYDYSVPGSHLSVNTYVRFSSDILLGYVVANAWLKAHFFDQDLMKRVFEFYDTNPSFRTIVMKFLIRIAFEEQNTGVLSGMLPLLFPVKITAGVLDLEDELDELLTTLGTELRRDKKTRDTLVPYFARSEAGQFFYFNRFFDMDSLVLHSGSYVDLFIAHSKTHEGVMHGLYLKFMQSFMLDDVPKCRAICHEIKSQSLQGCQTMKSMAEYFSVQVICHYVMKRRLRPGLLQKIREASTSCIRNAAHPGEYASGFGQYIFVALNFGDDFIAIRDLFEQAFSQGRTSIPGKSWEFQLCRSIYARALLNTGHTRKAKRIYGKEDLSRVPYHCRNYVAILHMFTELEFLLHEQRTEEAMRIITKIKTISQVLKFKYFYKRAVSIEQYVTPS